MIVASRKRIAARARQSPDRLLTLAFGIAALPVLVRALVVPPLGWDALSYHALKSGLWVQYAGRAPLAAPGPWSLYEDLWGGHEIFMAWVMLPFHGDLLAMAADGVAWLGLGLTLVALARTLGASAIVACASAGFALASPLIRVLVGSGYVEVSLLVMTIGGLALAVHAIQHGSRGARWISFASAGVAAGIKFPALPASLLTVGALGLASLAKTEAWKKRAITIGVGLFLFGVGIGPWLYQGYRHTGLPFSPLPVRAFGVELGMPPPEFRWYMDRPIPADPRIGELQLLRRALFQEAEGPGITTMMAVGIGILTWPIVARRRPAAAVLLALIAVSAWLAYLSPSLAVPRHYFCSSGLRYLVSGIVLPIAWSGAAFRHSPRISRFYCLFLWAGSLFHLVDYAGFGISIGGAEAMGAALLGIALTAGAFGTILARPWSPVRRLGATVAMSALAVLGLAEIRERRRLELFAHDYALHPNHPYWIDAVAAVDRAVGERIALTSGPSQNNDQWLAYPLLGRSLQNEVTYVPVSADGRFRHFASETDGTAAAQAADFTAWVDRLHEFRITRVMSFRPAPLELGWMEQHPKLFRRIAGDSGDWGFFTVERRP